MLSLCRLLAVVVGLTLPFVAAGFAAAQRGPADRPCPAGSINVKPGKSIQAAVDTAREGATFCLKSGVHRAQVVRPKDNQRFLGEAGAIVSGSRLLSEFQRDGALWYAADQRQRGERHGECAGKTRTCAFPEGVFVDDRPLTQVLAKDEIGPGRFYFDYEADRIYIADDPTGRKVEATVVALAFGGTAKGVLISNLVVEKYANKTQYGAIQSSANWVIENSEVRLNNAGGVWLSTGSRLTGSRILSNGQIGVIGVGRGIVIENNAIAANNTNGFSFQWEAGGIKITHADGTVFRDNHVFDNVGPGIWCDINCRNTTYEGNLVERNHGIGIFHEISFRAVIRRNVSRHNGISDRKWFWGADILVAASQDVEVTGNDVTVSDGGCGIMLIDQTRRDGGFPYKTQNNTVQHNTVTFEGAACSGGISDSDQPGHENYHIITRGNNRFDRNTYRLMRPDLEARFAWGHEVLDWAGFRSKGLEINGSLEVIAK